ncbi:MAG TPA: metallophosphoesterase, partial [Candidatus Limnocylindria bacterium]|nr:metallophosphoesterase [Candidatus Limnocylindria bacterium]
GCAASASSSVSLTPAPSPTPGATAAPTQGPTASAATTPESDPVLIAAGDIANCELKGAAKTAALIQGIEGTVLTLGDNAYPSGSDATYIDCYGPTWGAFLDRTHPTVGNHDLMADGGAAYHRYFGDRAGAPGEGWYSFDIGDWHVVVLNSNCELIACGRGSPQNDWLTADLAASSAECTLAAMHHPRFSSGPHGDYLPVVPLWEALDAADVDLLLVGHDHLFERFAPQDAAGYAMPDGLREITVGTGGNTLYAAERVAPNSELIIDDSWGVLVLTLHPDSYDWSFVGVDGAELDSGSADCH